MLIWSLLWSVGVAVAVGLAAQHEVNELLDETLQATSAVLVHALPLSDSAVSDGVTVMPARGEQQFAWQLVAADGAVLRRSSNAPVSALLRTGTAGFSEAGTWRVFGSSLTGADGNGQQGGRMLYVAHTHQERREAQSEVMLSAVLSALSIGLLGHLWLRTRVRNELQPLDRLSERLARYDPLDMSQSLGAAERVELAPVHTAIDQLGHRLALRVDHERLVAAHAAHALRTPLAGMDAQLAVALRESTPEAQPRLQRVRDASLRLQRVVRSLLDLFRIGSEVRRQRVDVKALLAHLPVPGVEVVVDEQAQIDADPDLLAAALLNLLDNAQRYGARRATVTVPAPGRLLLCDDGRGAEPQRLTQLRVALETQRYDGQTGLGLMLADLVARAHGGHLRLPEGTGAGTGFAAELVLVAATPA